MRVALAKLDVTLLYFVVIPLSIVIKEKKAKISQMSMEKMDLAKYQHKQIWHYLYKKNFAKKKKEEGEDLWDRES